MMARIVRHATQESNQMPQNPNDFAESSPNERYTPTAYTTEDRDAIQQTAASLRRLDERRTEPPELLRSELRFVGSLAQQCELFAAFANARAAFPDIQVNCRAEVRNDEGKFLYDFWYADLEAVVSAVAPCLGANKLVLIYPVTNNGDTYTVTTMLIHAGGGRMESELTFAAVRKRGRDGKDYGPDDQKTAGRCTYWSRYGVRGMLGIAAGDDDDGNAAAGNSATISKTDQKRQPDPAKKPPQPASQRSSAPAKAQEPERPKESPVSDGAPAVPPELTEALGPPMTKEQDDRLHVICRERGLRTAGAVTRFAKDTLGVPLSALDMAGGASLAERLIKAVEELKPEDVARSLALRPGEAKS